jgi:hypothetical protein
VRLRVCVGTWGCMHVCVKRDLQACAAVFSTHLDASSGEGPSWSSDSWSPPGRSRRMDRTPPSNPLLRNAITDAALTETWVIKSWNTKLETCIKAHTKVFSVRLWLAATMHRIDPNTPEGAAFVLGPQSAMISLNLETLRGQVRHAILLNGAIFSPRIFCIFCVRGTAHCDHELRTHLSPPCLLC